MEGISGRIGLKLRDIGNYTRIQRLFIESFRRTKELIAFRMLSVRLGLIASVHLSTWGAWINTCRVISRRHVSEMGIGPRRCAYRT